MARQSKLRQGTFGTLFVGALLFGGLRAIGEASSSSPETQETNIIKREVLTYVALLLLLFVILALTIWINSLDHWFYLPGSSS